MATHGAESCVSAPSVALVGHEVNFIKKCGRWCDFVWAWLMPDVIGLPLFFVFFRSSFSGLFLHLHSDKLSFVSQRPVCVFLRLGNTSFRAFPAKQELRHKHDFSQFLNNRDDRYFGVPRAI